VRAHAELVAAPAAPGEPLRLERMAGQAPVAWRPAADAVYMVSTAASPVGDDQIVVEVRVRAGSRLAVRSTAATVAWTGVASRHEVRATVEPGAALDWAPEPLVATSGCHHSHLAWLDVQEGGSVRWRELLVLGRHDEAPGSLRCALRVDLAGRPLLRHELKIGAVGWDGPAVLGTARVVGLLLFAGAEVDGAADVGPEALRAGDGWAVSRLEGPGQIVYAVGDTVPEVERYLERGLAASQGDRR
jgi:urease accessory protein